MPTIKESAFSCSARYKAILYTRWICSQPWAGSSNPAKRCRTCAYTSDNVYDSLVFASVSRKQFPFSSPKKGSKNRQKFTRWRLLYSPWLFILYSRVGIIKPQRPLISKVTVFSEIRVEVVRPDHFDTYF